MLQNDIAIVDDNQLHRSVLRKLLEDDGFYISVEEETGEDFILSLSNLSLLPAICIVDILLPGMGGYETIRRIKEKWPLIKIIAYTGVVEPTTVQQVIESGADLLLLKGEHPKKVIKTIEDLFNDWKEEA